MTQSSRLLVRRLLPVVVGLLLLLGGLVEAGEEAGWYGAFLSTLLQVGFGAVAFSAMVLWTARRMDTVDRERSDLVDALRTANTGLDAKVQERTRELDEQNTELQHEMADRAEAERLVEVLFQSLPDQLCAVNADGYFVRANPYWEQTLGWSPEEMRTMHFLDLVHPDDVDRTQAAATSMAVEPLIGFENRWRARDGRYCWLSWNATLLPESGMRVAAARDISDRKALERSYQEVARRNEILARSSAAFARAGQDVDEIIRNAVAGLGAATADRVSVSLLTSDEQHFVSSVHRWDEASVVVGPPPWDEPVPLDQHGPRAQVFRSGEPLVVPVLDDAWMEAHLLPEVRDEMRRAGIRSAMWLPLRGAQRVLGVVTLKRTRPDALSEDDVTFAQDIIDRAGLAIENAQLLAARERAESELRTSEALFRSTFDNAPLGTFLFGLRPENFGVMLAVNDELCEMFGRRREEYIGRSMLDFMEQPEASETEAQMAELRPGGPVAIDAKAWRADGREIDLRSVTSVIGEPDHPEMGITMLEDITTRKKLERELTERALFDDLTGLAQRHLLMDRAGMALRARQRDGGQVALVFLDIDRFKDINDSYGHHAGDNVLRVVADRMQSAVRTVDTAARLAGDEFVVLCPAVSGNDDAVQIVERLHALVAQPVQLDGGTVDIAVSLGVAVTEGTDMALDDLLRTADIAMYYAKKRGRNRWEIYDATVAQLAHRRLAVEEELREALAHDWFRLYYQPVIDITENRIIGVEALLRLEHPERGMIPPNDFIDIAEECDLIMPIGEWVLEAACRQAVIWNERFGPFEMSVNLSGRQIARPAIVDQVSSVLEMTGLAPENLCVEMTERVLIEADDSITSDVSKIADLGVQIALDDFGTGYSSLVYLKRFPITTVKIDRGFVHDINEHADDAAIVQAIAALAHDLNLVTVAEGVEHVDQLDFLRSAHCDRAQGYLVHKPAPADEITALLEAAAH